MASGPTDLGLQREKERAYGRRALPTNYYIAYCTGANVPSADTTKLSQLVEITPGNGYSSGGYPLNPNSTDFNNSGITAHKAWITLKNIQTAANGGKIPPNPPTDAVPKYAVLTDDNLTIGNREVYYYWDLGTVAALDDGQVLSTNGLTARTPSS